MSIVSIAAGGKEAPAYDITLVESVDVLFHYVVFSIPGKLNTRDITIKLSSSEQYVVLSESFDGKIYTYNAVPKKTYDLLKATYTEFTGNANVSSLLSKVGLDGGTLPVTNSTFWMIPSMRLSGVLEHIGNYASVSNGGGTRFFINLKGMVDGIDFLSSFKNKNAKEILGTVTDDVSETDWQLEYAGVLNVICGKLNEISSSELKLNDKYSKGVLRVNDTTGHGKDLQIQGATNQFWRHYYSSRKVSVDYQSGSDKFGLGDIVTLNKNSNKKFMVGEKVTKFGGNYDVNKVQLILYTNVEGS